MSVREKIYKQMIKDSHYDKYFEDNNKNCRALWNGINEIVYSKIKNKRDRQFQSVKRLQIKNILLSISTFSSQIFWKTISKKKPRLLKSIFPAS